MKRTMKRSLISESQRCIYWKQRGDQRTQGKKRMGSKWSIFLLIAMVFVTFHSSVAQTVHEVGGDSLRWIVPPGGAASYATWASGETFAVGDILVFSFTTGYHNVAEVKNKAAYDTCSSESFISIANTGPANMTLSSVGEHFYICSYPQHCQMGMKLAINVSTSVIAPVPAPASVITPVPVPAPAPASAPSPSQAAPTTYVVGDAFGWAFPPGGAIVYQTWAANKTFLVGDILLFNFFNGAHNVAQLTSKADFDSCNTSAVSAPITTASPAKITLTKPGPHFYICTFTRHCSSGQKLAINVTATPTSLTPSKSPSLTPSASPSLTPSTSPGSIAPSGSTTPPPPPSPSSAPKVMVASLTITLLSLVLALFT